jgi:RNA polymerase sigma-70 factor, ECF subfamily
LEKAQDLLVARLRSGDHEAAKELVHSYYDQIYQFMRWLGYSRHESEDLTQESFLQAWYHIGQLKDGAALTGWLYRIASNVSKMHWRKEKAMAARMEGIADIAAEVERDRLAGEEELEKLRKAVHRLPMKLRQTVVLHYLQRLSIPEAAAAAGVGQSAFKYRLSEGLKILRRQIVISEE